MRRQLFVSSKHFTSYFYFFKVTQILTFLSHIKKVKSELKLSKKYKDTDSVFARKSNRSFNLLSLTGRIVVSHVRATPQIKFNAFTIFIAYVAAGHVTFHLWANMFWRRSVTLAFQWRPCVKRPKMMGLWIASDMRSSNISTLLHLGHHQVFTCTYMWDTKRMFTEWYLLSKRSVNVGAAKV